MLNESLNAWQKLEERIKLHQEIIEELRNLQKQIEQE